MSISSAISNAASGLTAASRGTEIVSANIANSLTPGYARRELVLSSGSGLRGGVEVTGINRILSAGLLADNRLALADSAASATMSAFYTSMEHLFGTGQETSSLGQTMTSFEAALISAAARPDSETLLGNVLTAATGLADKLNTISESIQNERTEADIAIATDVGRLNSALEKVASLNRQIVSLSAQGKDVSSLADARQAVVDEISSIVPLKEVPRENGRVALFTAGGAILLDGTEPARIGFESCGAITPEMTIANGSLSRLTLNGKTLSDTQMDIFSGSTISANFRIRDEVAPEYQEQADGFAREIYERLADPAVDPSLAAGSSGLFTDSGGALDPINEAGFSGRFSVTERVNPSSGGSLWRIRTGVNATNAGEPGDSSLLGRLSASLSESRLPASESLGGQPTTMQTAAAKISSFASANRIQAEATALQDKTRQNSLETALLAAGVDTDTETESLLALERAYSANAKVLQTANDMLDAILGLT
jgi:flagellar hook-associated protein 1 FlgK